MTTTVDFNDVVPQEDQQKALLGANIATPVALSIAWTAGVGRGRGNQVGFATMNPLVVPPGTKAEGADFLSASQSTDSVNLTGGYIGFTDDFTRELDYDATINSFNALNSNAIDHLLDRLDIDGLTQFESATNAQVFGAAITDRDILGQITQFVVQKPNRSSGGWKLVLHPFQLRDVNNSLYDAGGQHVAGNSESERVAKQMGAREGFVGRRHGVDWFQAVNTPVTAGNATGAILTSGERGALGYRVWETVNIESKYEPVGKKWILVWAVRCGWVITKQSNIRGITSPATP